MVVPELQVDLATGKVTYRWDGGDDHSPIQGYGFTAEEAITDYWVNVRREAELARRSEFRTRRQQHALKLVEPEIVHVPPVEKVEPLEPVTPRRGFFRRLFRKH